MVDLSTLTTESRNPNTMNLDEMSSLQIAQAMNREDAHAVEAVGMVLPLVAEAIDWAQESLAQGGRIIYMGAGTSGRLGVLDAVECPPTFGVSSSAVVGIMAGGNGAFVSAVEGAEDDADLGVEDLRAIGLDPRDLVVGLAASGRTPYVIGAIDLCARRWGAVRSESRVMLRHRWGHMPTSLSRRGGWVREVAYIGCNEAVKAGTSTKLILT